MTCQELRRTDFQRVVNAAPYQAMAGSHATARAIDQECANQVTARTAAQDQAA